MRLAILFSLLSVFSPNALRAQGWQLMGDVDAYMGQYFFNHGSGLVWPAGGFDLQLAHSLSPESGYFFTGQSNFVPYKQVNEQAGGGTLFQQTMDNSLGFKWIRRYEGGFSLKPRLGARYEFFRATNDDRLGKGLYDNVRYEAGVALERKTRWSTAVPWTYQFSYDFYYTHYPHFTSLASQPLGQALGAPNPGAATLDAITNQFTYRSDFDLPGFASIWGMYSLALINYTDAKVVNAQDQYLDGGRSDAYQTIGVGYSKRLSDIQHLGRIRPVVGLGIALNDLISNQNNFDTNPGRNQYIGGYFNYWETRLTPSVQTTFLKTLTTVRVSYDFGYRSYTGRLTQLADGTYTGNKLYQFSHNVQMETTQPIVSNLSFKFDVIYGNWSSNTHYQQAYVYDFTSWNYFAGLGWRL